jgi:hypothetical protein
MNNGNGKGMEGSGRGLIEGTVPAFACMERKTTKNLNQDSRTPGGRLEPGTSRIVSESANHSSPTSTL